MTEIDRYEESKRVTIVGMFVNTFLALIKIIIGLIGQSSALFADGIHSLSDLVSDVMVLFAAKHANKGADFDHPYGHERIETLATVILSVILMVVAVLIAYHAIENWYFGELLIPDTLTIYAAIISILANEGLFRYTMRSANKINSDLLRANAWHSRSDMYSSVVVLIGLIGTMLGVVWMDAVAAIIVAYMIAKMGVKWAWKSLSELIDTGVDRETLKQIERIISNVNGVKKYHCLRTRKMAGQIVLDVHILVDEHVSASEGHYIAEHVRGMLAERVDDLKDVTVHVDVSEHPEQFVSPKKMPPARDVIIKALNDHLSKYGDSAEPHTPCIIFDRELIIYYGASKIELYFMLENEEKAIKVQKAFAHGFMLTGVKQTDAFVFLNADNLVK
ncbi:cation diffusion facilitator family transporter [Fangia hongkongensis]|uniref:cation diffusion facilitator family transporter n=2 Tax=Fangia hongkongensis TaxID=270495 RepID=UPI00036ACB11|nr:cation diffusion facilitator family transporter [Fangia hongkongensis]